MHDHLSVLCWEDVINLTTESVCAHIGVCARVCLCARILHLWFKLQNRRDICGCVCTDVSGSCFLQLHYPRPFGCWAKKKAACYAHLSVFCFNDAEAHNCFKMLSRFLAILRGLTVDMLRVLRSTEGF